MSVYLVGYYLCFLPAVRFYFEVFYPFGVVVVQGDRDWSSFLLPFVDISFPSPFVKDVFFPPVYIFGILSNIRQL